MTVSRRAATRLLAGFFALPVAGTRSAFATSNVRFSLQRSSTLLTLLKADGALNRRLAAAGFDPNRHLFDDVLDPTNTGAVDFHADVADAVPVFTQAAGAQLTFYGEAHVTSGRIVPPAHECARALVPAFAATAVTPKNDAVRANLGRAALA